MNASAEIQTNPITGLSQKDIPALQKKYGKNIFSLPAQNSFVKLLAAVVFEPMFLMLVVAAALYFFLGKPNEGWMMAMAILFVTALSVYQGVRSSNAMTALEKLTAPGILVFRDGISSNRLSADLVPGDIILLQKGNTIPADAKVIQKNDLSVDESVLTGESFAVDKNETEDYNNLFQGTTVVAGRCQAVVTATGNRTKLASVGKSIVTSNEHKTLLEQQINRFVKQFTFAGIAAFFIIWIVNYSKTGDVIVSLLLGLTLATAAIPEEIPVAFASFMALGAYHMSKFGIISKQPQTIENLGEMTVLCLDKTGTVTENFMDIKCLYDFAGDITVVEFDKLNSRGKKILLFASLASEIDPFDSMEKAINALYNKQGSGSAAGYSFVNEYPLAGRPPMMTHVYAYGGSMVAASKGAAEKIMSVCKLDEPAKQKILAQLSDYSSKGLRVIAIASAVHDGVLPQTQEKFDWQFQGLLGFYDPPKKNIADVFSKLYAAKIAVKMITGDFAETALNIATSAGILTDAGYMTGEEVVDLDEKDLRLKVKPVNVFARMFPEAKLRVINALKANGEIVGMTGDGVNDAPALHAAHIGIAMGKNGTAMAREASDLVLTDDDPAKIVAAIEQGRKIFSNFKKAVRYIISIHIPIILTASLPLLLNWKYPNIFSPVHIIFLELIMGPTCSVFFEREPVEQNSMQMPPSNTRNGFFNKYDLVVSIVQGLAIASGVLLLYYGYMQAGHTIELTRTMVFTTLLLSNINLTFVNRSFTESIFKTILFKNNLALPVLLISVLFTGVVNIVTPVRNLFEMGRMSVNDFLLCLAVSILSVAWFEVYKIFRRI